MTKKILFTPDSEAAGAAAGAGFAHTTFTGPTMVLDYTPVPEPSTYILAFFQALEPFPQLQETREPSGKAQGSGRFP